MKTSDTILLQLAAEQSTTDALADTLRQPPIVIAAFCCDLETAGLAASSPLGDPALGRKLATWRITEAGREAAAALQATCTATA